MRKIILLILSINFMFATTNSIAVQGVLRDNYNRAVADGQYNLTFTIYSSENGSNVLWGPKDYNGVGSNPDAPHVLNGVYSVDLEVGTDIQSGSDELWLHVAVNGSPLDGRVKINLTPYEYYHYTGQANHVPESGNVVFRSDVTVETGSTLEASITDFNNSISASDIATDAVDSAEIATDAVDSDEIAANAVGASEITANAVGASEIATDAVDSAEIKANAVKASEIATDAVDSAEIKADAVDSAEIAAGAVDRDHLSFPLYFDGSPDVKCTGSACFGDTNFECGDNGSYITAQAYMHTDSGEALVGRLSCNDSAYLTVQSQEAGDGNMFTSISFPCPRTCSAQVSISGANNNSTYTTIHQFYLGD